MIPVAREGRTLLLFMAAAAALLQILIGLWVAIPAWVCVALLVFVFRELPRQVPASPLANLSPVDGRVTAVRKDRDPYLERDALVISAQQSLLGEFNVFSPIEGQVSDVWWPDRKLAADNAPKQVEPRFAVWLQSDEGDDVVMAFGLRARWRYLRCSVQSGERVGQGQRCGFLGFGRSVEIYLPPSSRVEVERGQPLKAANVVIATLVRSSNASESVGAPGRKPVTKTGSVS